MNSLQRIFSGAASVLDIAPNHRPYEVEKDSTEADRQALAEDWGNVERDLMTAFEKEVKRYDEKHKADK